jgi:methyl-accepting chemotaxis protein
MGEVKVIFENVDSYMKNFSIQTRNLQAFFGTVQAMMQEVEAKAEISADISDQSKNSLENILSLVNEQHESISSLSKGFGGLENQIRSINQ